MKPNLLLILSLSLLIIFGSCSTTYNALEKSSSESTTIYLVRHAEKADDGTKDPDLTKTGLQRADKLYHLLKDKDITTIYSTDYKRTRQTAMPCAQGFGLTTQIYNPRALEEFALNLKKAKGKNILVTGHSNSTPTLANHILGIKKYSKYDESEYSNLIIITIKGDQVSSSMALFGQ